MVGEVRHPAGDPPLPAARRRQARPASRTSASPPGSRRPRGTTTPRCWRLRTSTGDDVTARFYVMATGCLSMPKTPDIEGADRFAGEVYFTSRWPHEGVDFTGKRVGVIGTGSSGIQSIPLIAKQAAQLTVFQRTANFSLPAQQRRRAGRSPGDDRRGPRRLPRRRQALAGRRAVDPPSGAAGQRVHREEQLARLEAAWEAGELLRIGGVFADQGSNLAANDIVASSSATRSARSSTTRRPPRTLCPNDHPIGTKRPCLDTGYYETFNLPHVRLVDLRQHADRDDHRDRHRDGRRGLRVRRHRLRHRLRRDDRRARSASTSPAATA